MKAAADVAAFVLDCSVTLAWFLPGERTSHTEALLDRVTEGGGLVPSLWRLEVANVMLAAERRNRITQAHRQTALAALRHLPIHIDPETSDHAWTGTLNLAAANGLTLYDAAYLELSLRTNLPLATLDHALSKAAQTVGVAVLGR
jgi:predicted nucleic acid-binding protein